MDHFFLFLRINQTFTNNNKIFYMILLRFSMFYLDYENIFGWIYRRKKINHIPRDKPQTLEVFNQFHWQPCATNVENLKLMLTIRICDEFKYCKFNQASARSQEMLAKFVPNNTAEFHILTSHIMASFFFSLAENTFGSNF